MIEAMAQVGACALLSLDEYRSQIAYLAGVDKMRFKKPAFPGDTLLINAELLSIKGGLGKGKGRITVNDEMICGGEFLFAIKK